MVLLVTVPTPPLSARCACAQHEPFVCFTLGFSALLAPLALLALQVHSCVNFPAKISQSASRPPPGQQTPVCVIALLLQALVSEPRRVKNKNTNTHPNPVQLLEGRQNTDESTVQNEKPLFWCINSLSLII